jgi:hypothetical protein
MSLFIIGINFSNSAYLELNKVGQKVKKKKKKKKKSDIGDGFHGERVRCMCVQEICQAFFVQEATRKRGNTIMANAEYAGETGKESKTGISRA